NPRLFDCYTGFKMSDDAKKTGAAHDSLIRQPCDLEWFRRPYLRRRANPRERHGGQHANNRVRHAAERNTAPDNTRITVHSLVPEVFRHHRNIGGFFFVRQKGAAPDRTYPEHIEIIRCHLPAEDLHRIAETGERERGRILCSKPVEDCLTLAKML